jgi:selenocysteine lyase/cysteine desulfurase
MDMIENQKALFSLDENLSYLNGAYMSPQLNEVTQIGLDQMTKKSRPEQFGVDDFFEPRKTLKKAFAALIGASDFNSIAIIPSVSYGIASVANNIVVEKGEEIIVCEAQFPSHIYSWQNLVDRNGGRLVIVEAPPLSDERTKIWNERILSSINIHTKVVAIPQVHWADGTLFDLNAIRKRSSEVGAKLIIDGTQSIGAFPFSIEDIQPDALICGGYKWLMGPYGLGVAYFSESFWDGQPIEHNWLNRYKSEDFANLTKYQSKYQPGAERFSVGESSNFVLLPMLTKSIEQVIEWNGSRIQEYCGSLIERGIDELRSKGCFVEKKGGRGNHLFGVYLSEKMDVDTIKKRLKDKNIFVSFRGDAIRVSPHVYNERADFEKFVSCIY